MNCNFKRINIRVDKLNYNQTKNKLDETISDLAKTNGKLEAAEIVQKQLSDKTSALETWKSETNGFLATVCTKEYFTEQIQKVDLSNYLKKDGLLSETGN